MSLLNQWNVVPHAENQNMRSGSLDHIDSLGFPIVQSGALIRELLNRKGIVMSDLKLIINKDLPDKDDYSMDEGSCMKMEEMRKNGSLRRDKSNIPQIKPQSPIPEYIFNKLYGIK